MHKLHSHRSLGEARALFACAHPWILQIFRFSALSVGITYAPGWFAIDHWPLSTVRAHVKYANVICICGPCAGQKEQERGWSRRRRSSKCSGKRLTKFALNAPVACCQCVPANAMTNTGPIGQRRPQVPGTYANETQLWHSSCTAEGDEAAAAAVTLKAARIALALRLKSFLATPTPARWQSVQLSPKRGHAVQIFFQCQLKDFLDVCQRRAKSVQ